MSQKAPPTGRAPSMSDTDEVTARALIQTMIHRYASLARENIDHLLIAELFQPDGIVQLPDGREMTPAQLGEITSASPPKLLRHHLTTIDIQFQSPVEAHCQSYVIANTDIKMPDHWGRWDDVVKRQANGKWLFVRKTVIADGMDPDGWLAKLSTP